MSLELPSSQTLRGIWVLGLVSLLMHLSSEAIHAAHAAFARRSRRQRSRSSLKRENPTKE
jgi:hypothetical protein